MSGQTPEQEPSIEEILASIRQIISDDDEAAPAASIEPEPVDVPEPVAPPPPPAPEPKEDILELKDPLPPPAPRPVIDMEDAIEEEDEEEFAAVVEDETHEIIAAKEPEMPAPRFTAPDPVSVPPSAPRPIFSGIDEESILSETARSAALSGFSKLASNMTVDRGTTPQRTSDGTTLEDILRDMLNPMLRVWLDENLPTIIEKLVQKELDKLARRASDD